MPVSDYLLSLALALHPQGDAHKVPLTLGAAAVSQPDGGARLVRTLGVPKKDGGDLKTQSLTPEACVTGKHIGGVKYEDKVKQQSTLTTTRQEHIAKGAVKTIVPQKCATGEHFPK